MSRGMVYEDAEALYAEVKKGCEEILEEAFCVLFPGSVPVQSSMRSKSLGGSSKIIAFNTTFFSRWDIIRIPSLSKAGPSLKNLVLQPLGGWQRRLCDYALCWWRICR